LWTSIATPVGVAATAAAATVAAAYTLNTAAFALHIPKGSLIAPYGALPRAGVKLTVRGADLLNGTPVVDIKPYIPFVESIPGAVGGFAALPPPQLPVSFSADADAVVAVSEVRLPGLRALVSQVLAQDPRPAFHSAAAAYGERDYVLLLHDLRIVWRVTDGAVVVSTVASAGEIARSCSAD